MPTYEYICNSCGRTIEQFQGIKDDPVKECPQCSGPLRRVISGGTGFIVKSGGLCYSSCSQDSSCCGGEEGSCGNSGGCGCE